MGPLSSSVHERIGILLSEGLSKSAIARELNISRREVAAHVERDRKLILEEDRDRPLAQKEWLKEQDNAFCAAMRAAIEAGLENMPNPDRSAYNEHRYITFVPAAVSSFCGSPADMCASIGGETVTGYGTHL